MPHCRICDFSDSVVSSLYQSLEAAVDPIGNALVFDEKTDTFLCVDCIGASLANYRSLEDNDNKKKAKEFGEVEFELEDFEDDQSLPWDVSELEDDT